MKKIAFVNSPANFLLHDGDRCPLGLCYLASQVRKNHDVKIFDFSVGDRKELLKQIQDFEPKIIGFTATTPIFYEAVQLMKEIAIASSWEYKTVIGGVQATAMPEYCLKWFDYIITGEADFSFRDFCNNEFPKERIIKSDFIDNINGLFPSRDLVEMKKYNMQLDGKQCATIITSRGCPYNCIYCSSILGKKVRLNSAKNVVDEICNIISKYGITSFYFLDDVFTIDRQRVLDICNLIKMRGLNISFRITTRINLVDKEILKELYSAGCKMMCYGLESGSDRVLNLYNKYFTVNDIKEKVKMTKDIGLSVKGFWMTSFLENDKDKKATKDLMKELELQNDDIYNLTIYPGSELWEKAYNNRQDFNLDFFKTLYHGGK
jgi:anaerobic magnesium-protoporphyrin IX monomethyl ester cyclase